MSSDGERAFQTYLKMFRVRPPVPEYMPIEGRKFRIDFAWPAGKIGAEIDGGQFKKFGGRHSRDSDREKTNLLVLYGWRVLHFSPEMLSKDPNGCMELLIAVLKQEGL